MRDRFNQKELWENLGLPVKEAIEATMASEQMALFRKRLFTRIVPTVGLPASRRRDRCADLPTERGHPSLRQPRVRSG